MFQGDEFWWHRIGYRARNDPRFDDRGNYNHIFFCNAYSLHLKSHFNLCKQMKFIIMCVTQSALYQALQSPFKNYNLDDLFLIHYRNYEIIPLLVH